MSNFALTAKLQLHHGDDMHQALNMTRISLHKKNKMISPCFPNEQRGGRRSVTSVDRNHLKPFSQESLAKEECLNAPRHGIVLNHGLSI